VYCFFPNWALGHHISQTSQGLFRQFFFVSPWQSNCQEWCRYPTGALSSVRSGAEIGLRSPWLSVSQGASLGDFLLAPACDQSGQIPWNTPPGIMWGAHSHSGHTVGARNYVRNSFSQWILSATRNYVRNSFSQWTLSMTITWTQNWMIETPGNNSYQYYYSLKKMLDGFTEISQIRTAIWLAIWVMSSIIAFCLDFDIVLNDCPWG